MPAAFSPLSTNLAYYEGHAVDFDQKTRGVSLEKLYEPFIQRLPNHGRILDAGCGSGRDAAAFSRRGYQVRAFDASPALVKIARSRGVEAFVETFEQIDYAAKFDGVWACASLLHVPRANMSEVLQALARALVTGGVLYVSLKEGAGERVIPDGRFFSYFTLKEFEDYLTSGSLFIVDEAWKTNSPDSSGGTVTWLNFLATKP